jgi:hypothetical protein
MSAQPQDDLLAALRGNLRRIEEEHRDKDLTLAALALKQLLLRRIANIEAAMKNLNEIIQRNPQAKTPPTSTIEPPENLPLLHQFCGKIVKSMGHRLPRELLDELRTYLRHFDETGHLGETDTVAEIKRRLLARIAEVEAELESEERAKDRRLRTATQRP